MESRNRWRQTMLAAAILWIAIATVQAQDFQFETYPTDEILFTERGEADEAALLPTNVATYEQDFFACPNSENKLMMALVLRSNNWDEIISQKQKRAAKKLSSFFVVPMEYMAVTNVYRRNIYEMTKLSVAHGANHLDGNKKLGKLEFMIGCGNEYFPSTKTIATQIGEQMKDGTINDISQLDFGMWIIWSKRYNANNRVPRNRRDAKDDIEGSGEDDFYDYENEDEPITEVPVLTDEHPHRHHHGNDGKPTPRDSWKASSGDADDDDFNLNNDLEVVLTTPPTPQTGAELPRDIKDSVIKLESDISKTIENNKLIEVQKEIDILFSGGNKILGIVDEPRPEVEQEEIIDGQRQKFPASKVVEAAAGEDTVDVDDEDDESDDDVAVDAEMGKTTILLPTSTEAVQVATSTSSSPSSTSVGTTTMKMNKIDVVSYTPSVSITTTELPTTTDATTEKTEKIVTSTISAAITTTPVAPTSATLTEKSTTRLATTPSSTIGTSSSTSSISSSSEYSIVSKVGTTTLPTISTTDSLPPTTTPIAKSSAAAVNEYDEDDADYEYDNEDEFKVKTTKSTAATETTPVSTTPMATTAAETTAKVVIVAISTTPEPTTTPMPTTSPATTTPAPTTTSSTTTTPSTTTEFVEPEPSNYAPTIKNRLAKQPVTAGKIFSFIVPLETFQDTEDGHNLRYALLDKAEEELKPTSWIQFNPVTREVYGLPLEDAVSKWQFKLRATDSANESVTESLDISVQQHKAHRSANHEISIGVRLMEKFARSIDWQIQLVRSVAATLGDQSAASIVVREVRQNQQEPLTATLIFTNDTLPKDKCPEEKLDELFQKLTMKSLSEHVQPEMSVKSVSGKPIGPCAKTETPKPKLVKPTQHMTKNFPPVPRNQVDRVNATRGQLLVFKVPVDTFYDPEDNTDLKLSLLSMDRSPLDPKHWLQFDSKNHEFYGIPNYGDLGQQEFVLVAEDREGLTASDALVVAVSEPSHREYNIMIEMTLGMDFEDFSNSAVKRRFVERIAQIYGDASTNVQIRSIRKIHKSGKMMVSYYNTTLHRPHHVCPLDAIDHLKRVLQLPDGSIRHRVKDLLGDEFDLTNVEFIPVGACHDSSDTIRHDTPPIGKPNDSSSSGFKDDYLLTFVLPAVIIIVMLLLASIVACVLHRRRLTGKMEIGDEEERRSFRSKGIPVIFQDELDEKPEVGNKSPVILKDEKPPLLPPSYNSTNPDDNDDMDEYVPPPAVVINGRDSRGKSPVTPSYRKPPPYVSP